MEQIRNADTNTLNLPKIGMTGLTLYTTWRCVTVLPGGSVGSENAAEAIRQGCEELIERIRASDNEGVVKALDDAVSNEDKSAAWAGMMSLHACKFT